MILTSEVVPVLIKPHGMKTYEGREVQLHAFIIPALVGASDQLHAQTALRSISIGLEAGSPELI
jgi:hypothetical protein